MSINNQPEGTKNTNILYSHHIFLFPFKWESPMLRDKPLDERIQINEFREKMSQSTQWKRLNPFKIDTIAHYNQFNFFHDFVRESLFDMEENGTMVSDLEHHQENSNFLDHYSFHVSKNDKYIIQPKKSKKERYELELENIVLQVYQTGVGVLSFHVNNRKYSEPKDVFAINKLGRRLYPPFIALPFDSVGSKKHLENKEFTKMMKETLGNEIPNAIILKIGDEAHIENFSRFEKYDNFKSKPFQIPNYITALFPEKFLTGDKKEVTAQFFISPVLDDRMFTICWYGNADLINKIKGQITPYKKIDEKQYYNYETDSSWYEYVFLDNYNGKTCQNTLMTAELLRASTYGRWVEYGTLYGASRYSFMCLTSNLDDLIKYKASYIVTHIQTMYYKMVELVLLQRACLLRFSDEISYLASLKTEDSNKLAEGVSNLLKQYIRFVNKIYFREITAQEQGIELYNLLQKQMDIERHVKDLDSEIQELHQFVELQADKVRQKLEEERNNIAEKQNNELAKLNKLAALILPSSLLLSFLGLNYFGNEGLAVRKGKFDLFDPNFFTTLIILIMVLSLMYFSKTIVNWLIKVFKV
jgi:hypothetical protein